MGSASEIDREARKGKLRPSDHAPLIIDFDSPGYSFDAGGLRQIRELQRACGTSDEPQ